MTDIRNTATDAARADDCTGRAPTELTVTTATAGSAGSAAPAVSEVTTLSTAPLALSTAPSADPPVSGRRASPTLEDVAAAAGVSRSTASRAINGGSRVSADALAAVLRQGFSPNRAARNLVTHRADSVALVVPEPDDTSCPGGVAGSALSPGRRT